MNSGVFADRTFQTKLVKSNQYKTGIVLSDKGVLRALYNMQISGDGFRQAVLKRLCDERMAYGNFLHARNPP